MTQLQPCTQKQCPTTVVLKLGYHWTECVTKFKNYCFRRYWTNKMEGTWVPGWLSGAESLASRNICLKELHEGHQPLSYLPSQISWRRCLRNDKENLIAPECLECQLLLRKCERRRQQSLAWKHTCAHVHTHAQLTYFSTWLSFPSHS